MVKRKYKSRKGFRKKYKNTKRYKNAAQVFAHKPRQRRLNRKKRKHYNDVYRLTGYSPEAADFNARYK